MYETRRFLKQYLRQEKLMKSLWAVWLIYYSDIKGKFNKKAFNTLFRLEKYFMYLPCKYTARAIVPFCIRLSEAGFGVPPC